MSLYSAKNKALIFHISLLVGLSCLIACGGSTSSNAAPSSTTTSPTGGSSSSGDTVSITVVPSTASVVANNTQLFDATVSGASNTTATWQVNGVTGGNSTLGTISSSGLYTAPAVSATMTVTVTAISNDDSTKSASAVVTVSPASTGGTSQPVVVAITPTNASVVASKTQQFSATVSGTTNTAVTWQVNGVNGGNSSSGTVSSSGLYTAPAVTAKMSATVTAVSNADNSKSASATVTVSPAATPQPVSVAVAPTTASVVAGKTQQFSASVSGTSNTAVGWEVDGISGGNSSVGTISSSGLYTAPTVSSTLSVTVTAVSSADNSKSASAAVTVSPVSAPPPPTSSGPALYVSPSGSDSNDGSSAHPFATINKAANAATPGMTVHVAPGTYQAVTTSNSGTASQRIRYISDVQWGAKVMGTSSSEAVWMQDGSYVDLVGFDISGGSRLGLENNGSNVRILGNYVHNIAGSCSSSGGAGIDNSNYSASNDDIIGNIVGNIGPSPGSCNTVQGIYLSNSGGITANNIVFAVSAWGIQMWHAATNATIVNNTVFACYGGITVGAGDSPGGVTSDNTLVANNIVYENTGYGIYEYGATGTHNRYINNLVTGNPTEISLQNGLSATGTVTADPQFVNYQANGTGDYHLKSTSPAINAGTSTSAPVTDFSGGTRPVGGAWDIGAYEFGDTPATWPWY
jgi:Protein of unknown function (DUF1565)